jgi:hypothetical protein
MEIQDVELLVPSKEKQAMGAQVSFIVKIKGDTEHIAVCVPNNPENRHYYEIKDWYERQTIKPFDFSFVERE